MRVERVLSFLLVVTPIGAGACSDSNDMAQSLADSGSADGASAQDGSTDASPPPSLGAKNPSGAPGDSQTPPTTSGADVEAWLQQGAYRSWKCEASAHPQMKVSPHGTNRICSNAKTTAFVATAGAERPVGTAGVKELYDDRNALVGYAVYVKTKATSDQGASWYWYERVPLNSEAPNTNGVVADGLGSEGQAKAICVGCHAGAGSNADHTVLGSSDYVYTQNAL